MSEEAAMGHMPHAVWPRARPGATTPARSRTVGASRGKQVWGSSGELGIKKDGSWPLSRAVGVESRSRNISLDEAGAIGVPFVTAFRGCGAGSVKPDDVVLVLGGSGKVGQPSFSWRR